MINDKDNNDDRHQDHNNPDQGTCFAYFVCWVKLYLSLNAIEK